MNFDPRVWQKGRWLLAIVLVSVFISAPLFWISLLVFAGHFLFFRDPEPKPENKSLLFSPATGKVVEIGVESENKFLNGEVFKISIFLSIFDVHVNRAPMEGKVSYLNYVPGKFKNALDPESARVNESNWIGIQNEKAGILVRQISGAIARRIHCDVRLGEELRQGQKLGVICYGSRVECFLPKAYFKPLIQVGDRVHVGRTILGEWK